MAIEDLGPAEKFAAGAIGEPGRRRFFLVATVDGVEHAVAAEKEQVAALAARGVEILLDHDIESDDDAVERLVDAGLEFADPGEGRFRAGEISLGLTPTQLLVVTINDTEGEEGLRFLISPEQFRAMARVALNVVAAGRPLCRWCNLPMDTGGHECPARNGHHAR